MRLAVRIVTSILYVLTAILFLAAGAIILLVNTGWLPTAIHAAILEECQGNLETLHVAQELGSLLVFGGLITLWFVWNYEQGRFFHWSLTALWGLLAAVHWFDVRDPKPDLAGNLVIAVPLILFAGVGLARSMWPAAGALGGERAPVPLT